MHNDVYSENVCFGEDTAVLIDWGAAVRGSRWIDVAFALLSVRAEGGVPPPPLDFPGEPFFAAALSGHLAVEAPAPAPDWASPGSTLRKDMRADLVHALRWAAEELELHPLRRRERQPSGDPLANTQTCETCEACDAVQTPVLTPVAKT